jgi:flavin reductase (DIM6/NTAB) family NADH-FMN oxidoreductase RutF
MKITKIIKGYKQYLIMKRSLPKNKFSQGGPPSSVVLATCIDRKENTNIITLGMFMSISIDPYQICIGVSPKRYSHDLIMEQKEFAINVPGIELVDEMHKCGVISGRDKNKWDETGLTPIPSQKIAPNLIKECYGHLECKVTQHITCGDHTLIVGEVVAASADEEVLKDENQLLTKAMPIVQKNWDYYTLRKP